VKMDEIELRVVTLDDFVRGAGKSRRRFTVASYCRGGGYAIPIPLRDNNKSHPAVSLICQPHTFLDSRGADPHVGGA
jgi:hypothetical protein